jgi:hypothetical protein
MSDAVDPLVLDLLEWIGREPRPYVEVIDAWRTSCPRLPVWEEANARGFLRARPGSPRRASRGDAEAGMSTDAKVYRTFADFYPFYLSEHSNRTSRRLHFVGSSIALVLLALAVWTHSWWLVVVALLEGYAFAWVGHFFFEHNKPATFRYPLLSFMGDWRLWWDIVRGRIAF